MNKDLYDHQPDKIIGVLEEIWQEDINVKQRLINLWKRNAYFANGIQTLQYGDNIAINNSDQLVISRYQNPRFNMYQTNEIEPILRTLGSYLTRERPTVQVFSADRSERSKLSADLAQRVVDAKYDLDQEAANSRLAAYWGMVCGTVFRKDYWDHSLGTQTQLPIFDSLGNPLLDPETGEPLMRSELSGDNNIAILTGFMMSFDWGASSFEELPYIIESYLAPVDWVRDAFQVNAPGFTGRAQEVQADGRMGFGLEALRELQYAVPGIRAPGMVTGVTINQDKCLVREAYIRPSPEWPAGRLVILAGGEMIYDGDSPYFFHNLQGHWHPYSTWNFEPFIGRLYGKSLVESLIPLQLRLNEINGAILENANTVAKPDILLPEECMMKQGSFVGGGGRVYKYKSLGIGAKPERWQGSPLPEQFFQERENLIEQMVRIAGTNFVMGGQPPSGVTAAAAIETLLQNASSQQSDTMISWEKFHESAYTKKLNIIKKFATTPNKRLTDYLQAVTGDALSTEMAAFTGADIADGVTLKIEGGSMLPRSEKVKQDTLLDLMKQGALGPVNEDSPRGSVLRQKLIKVLDIHDLELEDSKDVEKAQWENARIESGLLPDFQPYDNHAVHAYIISSKMKDPLFIERASPEVKQLAIEHLQQHQMAQQQNQQQAQQAQIQAQQMQAQLQAAAHGKGTALPTAPQPSAEDELPMQ